MNFFNVKKSKLNRCSTKRYNIYFYRKRKKDAPQNSHPKTLLKWGSREVDLNKLNPYVAQLLVGFFFFIHLGEGGFELQTSILEARGYVNQGTSLWQLLVDFLWSLIVIICFGDQTAKITWWILAVMSL